MGSSRTSAAAIRSLVRHAQEALAGREWVSAAEYAERAIAANGRNATARLIVFLADRHVSSLDQLPGVAEQIVRETPPAVVGLAEVLDQEAGEARATGAADAGHEDVRAVLGQNPAVVAPVAQRYTTLLVSRNAFRRVFEDADWQVALTYAPLDQRRAMERAQAEAMGVFEAALSDVRSEVSQACAIAQSRVPRVAKAAQETRTTCERALEELSQRSGVEDTAISESYAYLTGDIRTARVGLWAGLALVVLSLAMLALALVPGGSTTTNPLASFPVVSVPLALAVLVAGVALLAMRGNLVRSNRRGMRERVQARATAHGRAASRADRVNDEVASLRARVRALQAMRLDDDSFEDALEELQARLAVLSGAKAEPRQAEAGSSHGAEGSPDPELPIAEVVPERPGGMAAAQGC